MVQLDVFENNNCVQKLNVSDLIFNKQFNSSLVFQILLLALAFEKVGLKAQKNRGEVRGGGRKPWKQKGTGRARVGTIRSPLWRGGGVTFAARGNIVARKKMNKRMYKLALSCVLSELVRRGCLFVVNDFVLEKPSVDCFLRNILFCFSKDKKYLVILPDSSKVCDNVITRSAKNLVNVSVKSVVNFSIIDLVKHECVILLKSSLDHLCETVCIL